MRIVCGLLAIVIALPSLAAAQPPAPANYPPYARPVTDYVPPRTPDGQPDISGLYVGIPLPRNMETPVVPAVTQRNPANSEFMYSLNDRPKLPAGAIVRPAGVDPADGHIPLTPEAWAKRKEIMANQDKIEHLDGRVLCLAPGVPRTTVPQVVVGYQILQKPGYVVILYEQSHLSSDDSARRASAARPGHPKGHGRVPGALGRQRAGGRGDELHEQLREQLGHWIAGRVAGHCCGVAELSGHGIPHSDAYRVTERYTPIDANTIHYEARITDEKVFTQPWTVAWYGFARAPKDYVPIEYACFEGNAKDVLLMTNTDVSGIRVNVP